MQLFANFENKKIEKKIQKFDLYWMDAKYNLNLFKFLREIFSHLAFFLLGGGGAWGEGKILGGWSKLGGPLDLVYFLIYMYPKIFPPVAGQKSIKMFGKGAWEETPLPPPLSKKNAILTVP